MPDLPPPPPAQEQVVSALVDCGLDRAGIWILQEESLRSEVVRIKVAAKSSNAQFACIRAAAKHYIVSFEDDAQKRIYRAYVEAQTRPQMIAAARKALVRMDKLDGLPAYWRFPTAKAFFRALEVHCDFKAGQVFQLSGAGDWSMAPLARKYDDQLNCMFGGLMAQDTKLPDVGVFFSFADSATDPQE